LTGVQQGSIWDEYDLCKNYSGRVSEFVPIDRLDTGIEQQEDFSMRLTATALPPTAVHRATNAVIMCLVVFMFDSVQANLPPILNESDEISAALEGAPEHLRKEAGVMVLKSSGYVRIRESRNGFTCLLIREWGKSFEPTCYDAEGTATILPVVLYRIESLAKGMKPDAIQAEVTDGYFTGRFRAPRRAGVAYMLSKRNIVVTDRETQKVGPAAPHLMFYSPYVTNADMGSTPNFASHFTIADGGSPQAMIIVPIDQMHAHQ
jgi:hypothetical protein